MKYGVNENPDCDAKSGSHSKSPKCLPLPSTSPSKTPTLFHTHSSVTHLVPLGPELVHGDSAVGIAGTDPDVVALNHLLHLVLDGHDGLPLAVCLWQRCLELLMCSDQTLTRDRSRENPAWIQCEFYRLWCSLLHMCKYLYTCRNLWRKTNSGCFRKRI